MKTEEEEDEEEDVNNDDEEVEDEDFDPDEFILHSIVATTSVVKDEAVIDETNRASFLIPERSEIRTPRRKHDWEISVFNMEKELLSHFNKNSELMRATGSRLENVSGQLQHSQSVTVSVGNKGRKRDMFIFRRLVEGASIGLTELGKTVFSSNEVKYPLGIAIEDGNGELLAGCRSGVKAAELLGVNVRYNSHLTKKAKVNGTCVTQTGSFKVRYLTNDDAFGVTRRGKELLAGYTDDWVD